MQILMIIGLFYFMGVKIFRNRKIDPFAAPKIVTGLVPLFFLAINAAPNMQDLLGALLLIVVCTGGIGFFAILIVAYFIGAILFAIFNSLVTFGTGEKMSLAPDSTARRSKITEYIHQARAMDMKDAEIKKALIAKGWVQSIVEQELKKKHR